MHAMAGFVRGAEPRYLVDTRTSPLSAIVAFSILRPCSGFGTMMRRSRARRTPWHRQGHAQPEQPRGYRLLAAARDRRGARHAWPGAQQHSGRDRRHAHRTVDAPDCRDGDGAGIRFGGARTTRSGADHGKHLRRDVRRGRDRVAVTVPLIQRARRAPHLHLCVTLARAPAARQRATVSAEMAAVRTAMLAFVASISAVTVRDGEGWSVVASTAACAGDTPTD